MGHWSSLCDPPGQRRLLLPQRRAVQVVLDLRRPAAPLPPYSCRGDGRIWSDFDGMVLNTAWITEHLGEGDAILRWSTPTGPARPAARGRPTGERPAMIHDVDESLRALIRRDALAGTDVEVVLDAPTREWSARRNSPTLDLYLYDIREDLRRRENGLIDVHDEAGRVTARRRPPRYYKLSYLVTAWTQRPEDEHRLLSAVLACFLRTTTSRPTSWPVAWRARRCR